MTTQILKLSSFSNGSFVPVVTESKDNLSIGQVLQLYGYEYPKFAIVEILGMQDRFSCGMRYKCVNLNNFTFGSKDSSELEFISNKRDNRIQTYIIEGEILPLSEVQALIEKATIKQNELRMAQTKADEERNRLIEEGKKIYEKYDLKRFPAFIMAEFEVDNCDTMTDYFSTRTEKTIILAPSKHKRMLFSEMRKAAELLEETKHLGREASEKIEHRENYSMGAGYYLKASGKYSTGWTVSKKVIYSLDSSFYVELAKNSDTLIKSLSR